VEQAELAPDEDLARQCAEFAEDDRQMAEEGLGGYASALAAEDVQ
jgi:hypothetical protein